MALTASQSRFLRICLLILGAAVIVCNLPLTSRVATRESSQSAWDNLDAIRNDTLGFEKVFVISLPNRSDKRDNIVLGSSVTGFRIEWIDGVNPDTISNKTYPYNWNFDHTPVEYACRRAHVDGMQRIVDQRIGSALIMEDDADWDVTFKSQLQSFAIAVRDLSGTSQTLTHSPFGENWDILWLGHCGLECKTELPYYLTPNDPTIPLPLHFLPYWRDPPPLERPDHARLTCTVKDAACTSMYAVSYHGAQKVLSALSVNPSGVAEEVDIGAQIDVALGRLCGHGYLLCYSAYPSLTGGFRAAGSASKGSDIHNHEGGDPVPFASWGMMYSTMLNINRILRGEPTVHSTWEDVAMPDVIPESITMQHGHIMPLREPPNA